MITMEVQIQSERISSFHVSYWLRCYVCLYCVLCTNTWSTCSRRLNGLKFILAETFAMATFLGVVSYVD